MILREVQRQSVKVYGISFAFGRLRKLCCNLYYFFLYSRAKAMVHPLLREVRIHLQLGLRLRLFWETLERFIDIRILYIVRIAYSVASHNRAASHLRLEPFICFYFQVIGLRTRLGGTAGNSRFGFKGGPTGKEIFRPNHY